jgi:hypothetical protein
MAQLETRPLYLGGLNCCEAAKQRRELTGYLTWI